MAERTAARSRASALTTQSRVHASIRSTAIAIPVVLAAVSVSIFWATSRPEITVPVTVRAASRPEITVPVTVRAAVLTPDGTDGYLFDAMQNAITVAAPLRNTSGNLRAVFWASDASIQRDATTCATWRAESSDHLQQGAALRISEGANGSVRAITVTKNVYPYGSWIFNVHLWDSATGRMQGLVSISLESALSSPGDPPTPQPLPWRVCARTEGSTLRFKAWRLAEVEPAWGDPRSGGSVVLPSDAPTDGYAGWYAGHLHAGETATFSDLRTEPGVPADASGASAR